LYAHHQALKARLNAADAFAIPSELLSGVNRAFSAGAFFPMQPGALSQADNESRASGAK